MICADTSSLVALLGGEGGRDVEMARQALQDRTLLIAPITIAELLSDPDLTSSFEELVLQIPQLEITSGYWERAGKLRAKLLRHHLRPKIADTLIAQSCLDHHVPLVTRDRDFLSFQRFAGLLISAFGVRVQ